MGTHLQSLKSNLQNDYIKCRQNLQNACNEYIAQAENFKTASHEFATLTKLQATKVEETRLQSVGLNCITNQVEQLANSNESIHKARVNELSDELERLQQTLVSLQQVEQETQRQIDLLTSQ